MFYDKNKYKKRCFEKKKKKKNQQSGRGKTTVIREELS